MQGGRARVELYSCSMATSYVFVLCRYESMGVTSDDIPGVNASVNYLDACITKGDLCNAARGTHKGIE